MYIPHTNLCSAKVIKIHLTGLNRDGSGQIAADGYFLLVAGYHYRTGRNNLPAGYNSSFGQTETNCLNPDTVVRNFSDFNNLSSTGLVQLHGRHPFWIMIIIIVSR